MTPTVLGAVLVPAGIFMALRRPRLDLLYATVFFAPFTASAVVNFEGPGFGIQPCYFLGSLYLARAFVDRSMRGDRLEVAREQAPLFMALTAFLLMTVASITLIPWYSHNVIVLRPSGEYARLAFTSENVTQFLYIVFGVALAAAVGLEDLDPAAMRRLVCVVLVSGAVVCIIGWVQLGLHAVGLSYPAFLFNNNESFSELYAQTLPGLAVKRVNSVAPEPSMLARYLLIPTTIAAYAATDQRDAIVGHRTALALAIFFILTLLVTTSSTALGGLTAIVLLLIGHSAWRTVRGTTGWAARLRRQLLWTVVGGLTLAGAILAVSVWWLGLDLSVLERVADVVLFSKLQSVSGQTRTDTALDALRLFLRFPLLGVGWGSYRSFDLGTNLLVSIGLIGAASFVWLQAQVAVTIGRLGRRLVRLGGLRLAALPDALLLALLAVLVAKLVAEPGLAYLDYWLLVGMLMACGAWSHRLPADPELDPGSDRGAPSPGDTG